MLSTDQRIQVAVESFKAQEAYKQYETPSQLRALVVSQLTKHVLDEEFPPAQRVQCLKLLGSVAEIGLFVDRKETLVIHQSEDIKAKLIEQLKTITGQVSDITPNDDADSLLLEINEAKAQAADPTAPHPAVNDALDSDLHIHAIPLKISDQKSIEISDPESNK